MTDLNLLLWHWGRRGGGPKITLELARALSALPNVNVHLSLSRQSEAYEETMALGLPGFHVDTYTDVPSALGAMFRLPAIRSAFAHYLRDHRIDIVDCTMSHLWNPLFLPLMRRIRIPYVLTLHDAIPHPGEGYGVRGAMIRHEVLRADHLITLSEHVKSQAIRDLSYPADRIDVIPHGVFSWGEAKPRSFPRDRPFRLLFFGRIHPYKGLDLLLDAYKQMRAKGFPVELLVAGPGDISPYAEGLATEGVQVDNRWIPVEEIEGILRSGDLMVLPYVEASQSGVAATACGAALPVVATPVGGLSEQVQDKRTGLLAAAPPASALVDAITIFLQDPSFYESCSRMALEYAATDLAWPVIASKTLEVVSGLVEKN
ncbi:glycosyltransferase family 4 protein [Magnetospirillum fulvum]|uniref:Glycosyltransferase involved in cell wall bisynthesis n=1 Tax=Magnetospirillum fulvum TaxID=1082 RepID=A0A1H6H4B0_MAGFU|nr:glycosyltransferase family 4 protein [Magnetospirillum fulvum]SEH30112.1 Glycosyltransferase involved in cell wall bisynthesis [Magnetospirillum fulvum]